MSGKVIGWAMEQPTGSPAAKLVLVKLADNANEDGYCWPSVRLIVEHTELSDRAVRKHLRKLEAGGFIGIEPRISPRGQTSNAYQLNVPRAGSRLPPSSPGSGAGGRGHQRQGPPASAGGAGGHQVQGHEKNPQTNPPLNRPPKTGGSQPGVAALPWNGRGEALVRLVGSQEFETYFSEAELIDGPPPTIVVPKKGYAHKAMERFPGPLHRLFGEDVRVVGRVEWEREQAARSSEQAHSSRGGA